MVFDWVVLVVQSRVDKPYTVWYITSIKQPIEKRMRRSSVSKTGTGEFQLPNLLPLQRHQTHLNEARIEVSMR
jgi:hypothetical protein